jgi:hypothetical protein
VVWPGCGCAVLDTRHSPLTLPQAADRLDAVRLALEAVANLCLDESDEGEGEGEGEGEAAGEGSRTAAADVVAATGCVPRVSHGDDVSNRIESVT